MSCAAADQAALPREEFIEDLEAGSKKVFRSLVPTIMDETM
jgi:hypothetical protein